MIYYQYRADRARRTLKGIDEQVRKAQAAIDGRAAIKRNRFIKLSGAAKSLNLELECRRILDENAWQEGDCRRRIVVRPAGPPVAWPSTMPVWHCGRVSDPSPPVSDETSYRMSRIRSRDTQPELRLRSMLHALGYRYRVNARPDKNMRYTADLLFTRARVAVFIDGCFWHGCPEHFIMPKTRTAFWQAKIENNKARDALATELLEDAGWTVVRIWEHASTEDAVAAVTASVGPAKR